MKAKTVHNLLGLIYDHFQIGNGVFILAYEFLEKKLFNNNAFLTDWVRHNSKILIEDGLHKDLY